MWHQNNFPFWSLSKNTLNTIDENRIYLNTFLLVWGRGNTIKSPFDRKDDVTFLNSTPQQINASNINCKIRQDNSR